MQDNRDEDVIEIDLLEIFSLLLRWWWLIILSAVLVGAAGFFVSSFVLPEKYESTTEIYILNNVENVTYSDIQMGTQLTKDYAHLITTRDVLEQVIEALDLEETYGGLAGRISVQTPTDTRIVAITVTDYDPAMAQNIANKVREVASEHITNVMAIDAVNVASVANYPQNPSSPSIPKWTVLGFLIGGVLCAGVILVKYLLDDSIKTAEDVERYLELSTLGIIPISEEEENKKDRKKYTHSSEYDRNTEQDRNTGSAERSEDYDSGDESLEEIRLTDIDGGKEIR